MGPVVFPQSRSPDRLAYPLGATDPHRGGSPQRAASREARFVDLPLMHSRLALLCVDQVQLVPRPWAVPRVPPPPAEQERGVHVVAGGGEQRDGGANQDGERGAQQHQPQV